MTVRNAHVLVVGGSESYIGAVYLAAIAALRAGAESVVVMAPEKVAWALNALSPDLMTRKLRGKFLSRAHLPQIRKMLGTADILLFGNGVGFHRETQALMRALAKWKGKKVIDADALKALHGNGVENAILTPNPSEWDMLERHCDVKKLLRKNVIIQKGFPTVIRAGNKTVRQRKTNAGLQKAGTGDVLAGMCAGYLAQDMSLFDAAKTAVKTGSSIAEILTKKKKGYFFLASDIIAELKKTKSRR